MIIGISGKKYSGKDTAFLLISKEVPAVRFAFADMVKYYARTYFGVDPLAVGEDKEKTRFILQGVGEMFRNEVSKTYWTDQVFNAIEQLDPNFVYVITDVRYINEVEEIRKRGGKVFRVTRPGETQDNHPSETELTDSCFDEEDIIVNDDTLDVFAERIYRWMIKNA